MSHFRNSARLHHIWRIENCGHHRFALPRFQHCVNRLQIDPTDGEPRRLQYAAAQRTYSSVTGLAVGLPVA